MLGSHWDTFWRMKFNMIIQHSKDNLWGSILNRFYFNLFTLQENLQVINGFYLKNLFWRPCYIPRIDFPMEAILQDCIPCFQNCRTGTERMKFLNEKKNSLHQPDRSPSKPCIRNSPPKETAFPMAPWPTVHCPPWSPGPIWVSDWPGKGPPCPGSSPQ